jgi:opacity protein-like surface antigen
VFSYGGGVDFDINRHWSAKFDVQRQDWSMGKNSYFKPDGSNFTLSPHTYTFGVTYHFSFSGLNKQKELK